MPSKYTPGDFTLAVKRSMTGLGLFAGEAIPAGVCIIEYTGTPITEEQRLKSNSLYLFDAGAGRTIDGSPRSNRARYINHSCRPNCEAVLHRGRILIFSLRKIKNGEELAYDYGEEYMRVNLKNRCLCPKCRQKKAA
jgi:uncharacterized protein